MKMFLKIYLPLLIFFGALGVFLLIYMISNHAAVLKYFAGEMGLEGKGKIISTKVNAIVKEDGIEQPGIKTFEDDEKIYLVFEKRENWGYNVLIVDKERKDVFQPTVRDGYDLIFSKYLFQAEVGLRGDYLHSEKFEGYQTNMEATDSQINFQLPEYNYGKVERNRKIEIVFKGE